MRRLGIAVIGGGENCEHDVSLASAASVSRGLVGAGYDVVELTIGRTGGWSAAGQDLTLAEVVSLLQSCDVAFPVVHGPRGEDGSLAALLDFTDVPYVGSGVRAGAIAMDKWATKLVAEAVGVPTAHAVLVRRGDPTPLVPFPAVVKPVAAGSSFGVAVVDGEPELEAAIEAALELDDRVLVERFVIGREVDVAVLALPDGSRMLGHPLEIAADGRIFDTEHKYDGSAELRVPAALSGFERAQLERAALLLFDALGCDGVARVDFFLTANGPVLNEVNTTPGMTDRSQVPRMFESIGMPYPHLLRRLVERALAA